MAVIAPLSWVVKLVVKHTQILNGIIHFMLKVGLLLINNIFTFLSCQLNVM